MTEKKRRAVATSRRGRPTAYLERYAEEGRKLCLMGATNAQMGKFWNVSERTIEQWIRHKPDFAEAVRAGKMMADAEIAVALFHRARGYSHPAVKILQYEGHPIEVEYTKHYPPDTQACIFWLKNRQPELWKDVKSREVASTNRDVHMSLEEERRLVQAEAEEILKALEDQRMVIEDKLQGDTEQ
jgi:hypothetical protein